MYKKYKHNLVNMPSDIKARPLHHLNMYLTGVSVIGYLLGLCVIVYMIGIEIQHDLDWSLNVFSSVMYQFVYTFGISPLYLFTCSITTYLVLVMVHGGK